MQTIELPVNQIEKVQENELRQLLPAITFESVSNVDQLADVAAWRKVADKGLAKVSELFDGQVEAANKAHKQAVALRNAFRAPYEAVKRQCMAMMNDWEARQARIREEAERVRQEEIRRAERAAQEVAERERQAAAQALADAKASGDKAAAATARAELEAAKKYEQDVKSGNIEIAVPALPVAPEAPKIAGYSATKKWKADDNIDKGTLISAAAKDSGLQIYLDVNIKLVNSIVAKTEGKAIIPGVRAVSYMQTTQRTK